MVSYLMTLDLINYVIIHYVHVCIYFVPSIKVEGFKDKHKTFICKKMFYN